MRRIKLLAALIALALMNSCASSKNDEPLYFKDGIANLEGMWVLSGENPSELDVILDLALNGNSVDIKAWGKNVKSNNVVRYKDQILISYTTTSGDKFSILGQLENNNQMRISRTSEELNSFMPIGQLGEKVYRLTRIKEGRRLVVKNTPQQ
ncbi:hypothetical protein [Roseivirga misakiensis]|uniref:Lipocalin-like domain-containing protein n=1 Tax=Roseivirga misakiensis TaxID=1563681 RepID=A0A1E5T3V7_9BACT|nr:hypothetical protein [Roseivirga misakiensis]OEK05957.1 hypothetical protein BFP71_07545 [Roseivirga misakiensis]